ncbi:MAG: hypothetical protein M3N18_11860 [Actinomycetota bacterium]|nr:hypothetical protein [Actinomycetota bacterium]
MGSIDDRIRKLEEQFDAEAEREPSKPFGHMRAILDEFAALKSSCARGLRGGVSVEPENIPRKILGPGYTHAQLMGLAVSRTVEAGHVPAERAHAYLEELRDMWERGGRDPDTVVEWEREERYGA